MAPVEIKNFHGWKLNINDALDHFLDMIFDEYKTELKTMRNSNKLEHFHPVLMAESFHKGIRVIILAGDSGNEPVLVVDEVIIDEDVVDVEYSFGGFFVEGLTEFSITDFLFEEQVGCFAGPELLCLMEELVVDF